MNKLKGNVQREKKKTLN